MKKRSNMLFVVFAKVALVAVMCLGVSWGGCFNNSGIPTPDGILNFPGALRFSPDAQSLYVVNTNFDLRYSNGTLQSYDITAINQCIAENCEGICEESNSPYCCMLVPPESGKKDGIECDMLKGEVAIPSYAEGLALSEGGDRLFLPIRSDASLTVVSSEGGTPFCGSSVDQPGSCIRHATERSLDLGGKEKLELPKEPTGIIVIPSNQLGMDVRGGPADANTILTSHRNGSVSLFLESENGQGQPVPVLLDVISDLSANLLGVFYDSDGLFWVPNSFSREITRVGISQGLDVDDPYQSELFESSSVMLRGLNTGATGNSDVRVILFDPRPNSNRVYLLSRQPEALLIAERMVGEESIEIQQAVDLGAGPARMHLQEIEGRMFAFVSCYDSRDIYIIDVDFGKLVGIVGGIGGPFEMSFDANLNRLYVSDFRSFVIRIFALDFLFLCQQGAGEDCAPPLVGLIGVPKPLEEL